MLNLRPTGPGIIEGIVTSDTGFPVSNATVTAEFHPANIDAPPFPIPPWETTTNSHGEFCIRGLPTNPQYRRPIQYLITAHAVAEVGSCRSYLLDGYVFDVVHLVVPSEIPTEEHDWTEDHAQEYRDDKLNLDRNGTSVSGRVLDAETGRPIEGVTIQTYRSGPGPDRLIHATSGVDGCYYFAEVPPGHRIFIRLDKPGYRIGSGREAKHIVLEPGRVLDNVDFLLEKGLDVRGRVIDVHDNPIPGVEVHNTTWKDDDQAQSVVTDARGFFLLQGYAPDSIIDLEVTQSLFWARILSRVEIGTEHVTNLEIVVRQGASVAGILVDEGGTPVSGARMSIECVADEDVREYADSGEFGEFYFRGLVPGTYKLRGPGTELLLCLNPGELLGGVCMVRTQCTKSYFSISGRVVNRVGIPVSDARVCAFTRPPKGVPESWGEADTDDTGHFEVDGLGEGLHQITTCGGGCVPNIRKRIPAGAEGVEIVLDRLIAVAGNVVDDETGAPVRDFSVARTGCIPEDLEDPQLEFITCCDPDGRYAVWSFPGDITVIVRANGFESGFIHISALEEGVELEGQEIRLRCKVDSDSW